jgi:hypothetical protein
VSDDFRIRVELEGVEHARGLLDRLGRQRSEIDELVRKLREDRLVVSHDEHVVYVYADAAVQAERARQLVEAELAEHGLDASVGPVERWLDDEDRWETEPAGPDVEEELTDRGMAPWEVRVECDSHRDAEQLADRLESEGYDVLRRWRYVILGAGSEEEAAELAARLHGEAEPTSALVWEVMPSNPFVVFGGLGT